MKHMPDRYFHFRQLPFKEIKIKKNVCHSYPYFFPFPMFFVSFSLSYIRFLLPEERPLNISCSTDLLTSNSPQLLFLWKSLHFSLFFERYFHRTQNSELIFFFFSVLWRGDWTVSCLLYFWQWICSGFLSLCLQKMFFSSGYYEKFPFIFGFQQFDY